MFQFCSTHDIPRILWFAKGNRKAVLNCYQMAAMLPGGISVYYGDELLLTGGYDPDNRRCMPWDRVRNEPFASELFERIRQSKQERIQSLRPINADLVEVQLVGGRMTICMSR